MPKLSLIPSSPDSPSLGALQSNQISTYSSSIGGLSCVVSRKRPPSLPLDSLSKKKRARKEKWLLASQKASYQKRSERAVLGINQSLSPCSHHPIFPVVKVWGRILPSDIFLSIMMTGIYNSTAKTLHFFISSTSVKQREYFLSNQLAIASLDIDLNEEEEELLMQIPQPWQDFAMALLPTMIYILKMHNKNPEVAPVSLFTSWVSEQSKEKPACTVSTHDDPHKAQHALEKYLSEMDDTTFQDFYEQVERVFYCHVNGYLLDKDITDKQRGKVLDSLSKNNLPTLCSDYLWENLSNLPYDIQEDLLYRLNTTFRIFKDEEQPRRERLKSSRKKCVKK